MEYEPSGELDCHITDLNGFNSSAEKSRVQKSPHRLISLDGLLRTGKNHDLRLLYS
jgi:hypothetical protein